ncbi:MULTISPECIES: MOSC domain-containing protein [Bacillus]|uniref:MOSC domain-containing protein n=1 Tax=Bacillus TaxID=1386 RepID=UPI0002DD4F22|nr:MULTISPECIES: MOSC domain-containing protein [Bacillus]
MMEILSINIGRPMKLGYRGKELYTSLFKSRVNRDIYLGKTNFEGDSQADLVHHGGEDKAVCVYSNEHYPYWEEKLNRQLTYGAFGENLTVNGMLETDICIGDIMRVGEAIVQVSQPRQPCYKLARRYNIDDLPVKIQETGYTGFYMRVLQEGIVTTSPVIEIMEKDQNGITIDFANQVMHHDKTNLKKIEMILKIDALSKSWRATFTKRLNGIETDTKERLLGKDSL